MRAQESKLFTNISANSADFVLSGGQYRYSGIATFGGGSIGLDQLGPDGSTYLPVFTALTVNSSAVPFFIPPGVYRVSVVTATAVYVSLARIPGE